MLSRTEAPADDPTKTTGSRLQIRLAICPETSAVSKVDILYHAPPAACRYNYDMIHVTEAAAEKFTELLTEEHREGAGLRVFVQGGGCSGFQYGLMIDEGEGDASSDQTFEVNGVRLLVDPISMRYLQGAEVDFVDNNMGGGFTIKNPNAKSTCGCGSSFSA